MLKLHELCAEVCVTWEALSSGLSSDRVLSQGPCVECQVHLQNIIVSISELGYPFGKREPPSGKLPSDERRRLMCPAVPRRNLPTAFQIFTSLGGHEHLKMHNFWSGQTSQEVSGRR